MFDGDRLPLLTVHDELDFSASNPSDPIWGEIRDALESAIPVLVPIKVETEWGPYWGNLKEM